MATNAGTTESEIEVTELDDISADESGDDSEDRDDNEDESEQEDGEDSGDSEDEENDDSELEVIPDRLADNKAVALCIRAWHLAYDSECAQLAEDGSHHEARKEADRAFLDALPPLHGYQNICDFIACVNQAYLWEITGEKRTARLYAAAKLAINAYHLKARPSRSRRSKALPTKAEAGAANVAAAQAEPAKKA
jgi:hypothetical protein